MGVYGCMCLYTQGRRLTDINPIILTPMDPSTSIHTGETGTYRYMSSEVIRHEPYSTAADVYSFGVVLNELLTREQPFRGASLCLVLTCHLLAHTHMPY